MFYEVIPTRIFGKTRKNETLTYYSNEKLAPGQIVLVPFGRQMIVGVVLKKNTQPEFACKPIAKILYSEPLPQHLLIAVQFVADYYLVPLPIALSLILPTGMQKKRRKTANKVLALTGKTANEITTLTEEPNAKNFDLTYSCQTVTSAIKTEQNLALLKLPKIPLNSAQKQALEALETAPEATKLLLGVTGSGKTNIYLKMAENALKQQKSVILLVPEIALTGQLVRVFTEHFGHQIVLIHSNQTESERHQIFELLLKARSPITTNISPLPPQSPTLLKQIASPLSTPSGQTTSLPYIVIGPRSALFAPLSNLGLIIIDEAHEATYYQENTPKYSAIRVASQMAKTLNIPCILGSATPNLVDYYLAKKHNSLVLLTSKAKTTAKPPKISLIDFKNRADFSRNRYFSDRLLHAISQNLTNHQQTLIFHNRRGSSPLTICEHCGNEIVCPNCFLPLTLHADSYLLVCHTCNYETPVPTVCPACHTPGELIHKGFGTKLLETELTRLFKNATIRRFDGDTKKDESLSSIYDAVKNGTVDILIGTQTLAKGLDLPKLATVGVVQADAGLSLPDFSAEERAFELITQVIGRVGRGHLENTNVIIQAFRPDHPVLDFAIRADYLGFSEYLLKSRDKAQFPPYTFILKCEITLKTEKLVIAKIKKAAQELAKFASVATSSASTTASPVLTTRLTSTTASPTPVIAGSTSTKHSRLLISPPMPAFHEHTSRGYTWELVVRARSRAILLEAARFLNGLDPNFRLTLDPPSLL